MYKIELNPDIQDDFLTLEAVVEPMNSLEGYFWKLLWVDGESETDEYSVFELQEVIDQQNGIPLDQEQFASLSHKMQFLAEVLIIGDRTENNLMVNVEDETIYENEIVLELVRNSHWQIITTDLNVIDTYKVFFPKSEIID